MDMSKTGKSRKEATGNREPATGGRPKGSVSSTIAAVRTIRATCRACGSSDLQRQRVISDMDAFQPASGDRPATTRRRWTRAMCRKCGAWQTIIEDYNP
jgi:ribosomal protein L40E